ncbi:hypothetical protein CSQ96_08385 [Janthinobacterium sp. BJB412]|nr:hypothetical protein CSQ96_08385 [Janthinobacterium sp. BJB412]
MVDYIKFRPCDTESGTILAHHHLHDGRLGDFRSFYGRFPIAYSIPASATELSIRLYQVLSKPASLIGSAGFLLSQRIAAGSTTYQHFLGSYPQRIKVRWWRRRRASRYSHCTALVPKVACGHPNCRAPGKHPHHIGSVDTATTDPDTIYAWFQKHPTSNYGVRLGREIGSTGKMPVVVDVDRPAPHSPLALRIRTGKNCGIKISSFQFNDLRIDGPVMVATKSRRTIEMWLKKH